MLLYIKSNSDTKQHFLFFLSFQITSNITSYLKLEEVRRKIEKSSTGAHPRDIQKLRFNKMKRSRRHSIEKQLNKKLNKIFC